MKAPDKIYINVHPLGVDYSIVPIPGFGGVEYIRKDVLLEWAEECKKQLKSEDAAAIKDNIRYDADVAFDTLIDKIESM